MALFGLDLLPQIMSETVRKAEVKLPPEKGSLMTQPERLTGNALKLNDQSKASSSLLLARYGCQLKPGMANTEPANHGVKMARPT